MRSKIATWIIDPDNEYLWYPVDWKTQERVAIYRLLVYISLYGTNGQEDG